MTADPGTPASSPAPHVDLHAHSTASDGSQSPAAAVDAAHKAGLAAFALTDHDTLAGVAEAQRAADAVGLRLVPGVELSVHQDQSEVHLLGLHIRDVAAMQDRLEQFRDQRRARAEEMVVRLNALGIAVTMDAVLAQSDGGAIGRPHVAKERLEVVDGVRLIHEAGGIAVFAHPGQEGRRERIEPLVALGLDGIEVRHPSHSGEDMKRLAALTAHFGLVSSGGSDWHGAMQGGRVLGAMRVPVEWLDAQDVRVARVRAG